MSVAPNFSLGRASSLAMTGMWCSAMRVMRFGIVLALVRGIHAIEVSSQKNLVKSERSFTIENDRFVKDGKPLQIISGRCAISLICLPSTLCMSCSVSSYVL